MQAVAEQTIEIVNWRQDASFTLSDLYERSDLLASKFPRNHHVHAKIRQVLQKLRDKGFLTFEGDGHYTLNMEFADLEISKAPEDQTNPTGPMRIVERVIKVRLRNTLLATEIKNRYEHICQVCQTTVALVGGNYAEAHHVRPIGAPHNGTDKLGNILVACPNHHVMLDRGAVSIDPRTLLISHLRDAFEPHPLYLAPWHVLDLDCLAYYQDHIVKRT